MGSQYRSHRDHKTELSEFIIPISQRSVLRLKYVKAICSFIILKNRWR
ncbi:hypothetical protein Barb4_00606 [Bacteroidales bacterium Barb4]|nr:hypothetical protein Barb4_00606 [Bacteroidales bacterium Barb4]